MNFKCERDRITDLNKTRGLNSEDEILALPLKYRLQYERNIQVLVNQTTGFNSFLEDLVTNLLNQSLQMQS